MAKKILIMLFILLLAASCNQVVPSMLVFQGNYRTRQGNYQHAEVDYLKALKDQTLNQWIAYNLGNIYYSLGETESALQAWSQAEDLDDEELQFRLCFNRGVLYYDLGDFTAAYELFKKALLLNPADLDCKINLELALKKIGGGSAGGQVQNEQGNGLLDDTERLLYYIQNKEQYQWNGASEDAPSYQQDW